MTTKSMKALEFDIILNKLSEYIIIYKEECN